MLPEPTVPRSLAGLLAALRPCFRTRTTFTTFCALVCGMLAQTGQRTVCGMLVGSGLSRLWSHHRAHRFFSRAVWSAEQLGVLLAGLVVRLLLPADADVTVVIDDTLFKRTGRKVWAAGWFHDGSATGPSQTGFGNNWVMALQHEVAHRERAERIGGPSHRQSSSGLVLAACPHFGVRRRCCRLRGAKPGGEAQGLSFRPGVTGKGKTGRVNVSESSLTPRYPEPSWTGRRRRCRACRWETAVAAGWCDASRVSTTAPGDRGHPTRSYLRCVERGNTVVVHPEMGGRQGRPTPRRNMTRKKRTAAAERRQERARKTAPSSGRAYNWPHTRPRVWGRKTADVRGWAFDELKPKPLHGRTSWTP